MLKLVDLANRPDFQVGPLRVSPARRLVQGPAGSTNVEPIVMKVFLQLLEARGKVVTRDELFATAWGGVFVGDDSLNRAVGRVRKIAADAAPGLFEIETVPRTGYRLTGEILRKHEQLSSDAPVGGLSRRKVIAGGASATVLAGGAGLWWASREASVTRFEEVMARGDHAFHDGTALDEATVSEDQNPQMLSLYEEAVRLNPQSARAWGLLAYFAAAAADEQPAGPNRYLGRAQDAIRHALDLDPQEPNARLAMLLLQGPMLDWAERDRQLRGILATDPHNLPAMTELMPLLQAAGLTRESWSWNERILQASPLARSFLVVRAMKLWILGDVPGSDKVIDRVRALWPDFPFAFHVRLMLFTLTGRPKATLTMIDGAKPNIIPDIPLWRAAAEALESRSGAAIEQARDVCLQTAQSMPPLTNMSVMILCALGLSDTAFDLAEGYLLWRGKMLSSGKATARNLNDYNRRMTQWLFTPPAAAMRTDPRFARLCDEFGLTAYWRARHVRPDYQVYS